MGNDPAQSSAPSLPGLPPLPDNPIVHAGREVVRRLQGAGHEAYFVGGCVRDWLLGIEPYDVDVATSAHPDEIQKIFEETREVGARFGVVLVVLSHAVIETAAFRTEGAYEDFRRPSEVRYGTLKEDAERRDFTINALYYDPINGKLVDFFAGALDLRRRVLRTVGNAHKRFEEDALRLIRAVRLAVRYDLEIEDRTRKAILAHGANLAQISRERVGEELIRILTGPKRGLAARMMSDLKLWNHVIPEIEALKGVEQGPDAHPEGDVFTHTCLVLDHLPDDPDPALALGALLHDVGKPATMTRDEGRIRFIAHQKVGARMAGEICRRLKYSGELTGEVVNLVESHMRFMDVTRMKQSTLKRFLGQGDFQLHLDLHRADSLASHGDLDAWHFCVDQRRQLAVEHGEELLPKPLADGDDLLRLGLKPGPRFRQLLDELRDEQLEGRVLTREAALEFLTAKIADAS